MSHEVKIFLGLSLCKNLSFDRVDHSYEPSLEQIECENLLQYLLRLLRGVVHAKLSVALISKHVQDL